MKSFEKFLKEVAKKEPGVKSCLRPGASEDLIAKLEDAVGRSVPEELKRLYGEHDGEDDAEAVGIMFGLPFLPIENVIRELELIKSLDYDLTVMGTHKVSECPFNEHSLIPIGFDSDSCYIAMDLEPSEGGRVGQIITLDLEYNQVYLLADSLDDLFLKMTDWVASSKIEISGTAEIHNFTYLDDLCTDTEGVSGMVDLPEGYWREYGERVTGSPCTSIDSAKLASEKTMTIKCKKVVDCSIFRYMKNLKELNLIDCELTNVSSLGQIPELKTIRFARTDLKDGDLSVLSSTEIKEIGMNGISVKGFNELSSLKSLKILILHEVKDLNDGDIKAFTGLQELTVDRVSSGWSSSDIKMLKNLKRLEIHCEGLEDLDFLEYLPKLVEFRCFHKAKDEEGLKFLPSLKKLSEFIYPVSDISCYKDCPGLHNIGMVPNVKGDLSVLKGSSVSGYMVIGKMSNFAFSSLSQKIEKYVKITSYGNVEV